MGGKIIYEKKYPLSAGMEESGRERVCLDQRAEKETGESLRQREADKECARLPGRAAERELFITMAARMAEHYRTDIVITEYADRVSAAFSGACYMRFSVYRDIFSVADKVEVLAWKDAITLTLDFYTHGVRSF